MSLKSIGMAMLWGALGVAVLKNTPVVKDYVGKYL